MAVGPQGSPPLRRAMPGQNAYVIYVKIGMSEGIGKAIVRKSRIYARMSVRVVVTVSPALYYDSNVYGVAYGSCATVLSFYGLLSFYRLVTP